MNSTVSRLQKEVYKTKRNEDLQRQDFMRHLLIDQMRNEFYSRRAHDLHPHAKHGSSRLRGNYRASLPHLPFPTLSFLRKPFRKCIMTRLRINSPMSGNLEFTTEIRAAYTCVKTGEDAKNQWSEKRWHIIRQSREMALSTKRKR